MKEFNGKRLLSVRETARFIGISERTLYNQIHRKAKKKFPVKPKRIGRLVKIDLVAIHADRRCALIPTGVTFKAIGHVVRVRLAANPLVGSLSNLLKTDFIDCF